MSFEYLSYLTNITDYLLSLDFSSWSNWTAFSLSEVPFEFSEFQFGLLKLFSAILCVITALIVVFWLKYGEVISERFIRPSKFLENNRFGDEISATKSVISLFVYAAVSGTLKEIEELKLSVARLKLPREHTPRI